MKLHSEFMIQRIADNTFLVPVGDAGKQFHEIVQLNSTAAFIINCLKQDVTEEQIKAAMANEYEATDAEIAESIQETLNKLRECGALIE